MINLETLRAVSIEQTRVGKLLSQFDASFIILDKIERVERRIASTRVTCMGEERLELFCLDGEFKYVELFNLNHEKVGIFSRDQIQGEVLFPILLRSYGFNPDVFKIIENPPKINKWGSDKIVPEGTLTEEVHFPSNKIEGLVFVRWKQFNPKTGEVYFVSWQVADQAPVPFSRPKRVLRRLSETINNR